MVDPTVACWFAVLAVAVPPGSTGTHNGCLLIDSACCVRRAPWSNCYPQGLPNGS
jgi:hypothetical protein